MNGYYFQEIAEQTGNVTEVDRLRRIIDDLEQRASELDRRRTQNITGISWINQRNRDKMKETFLGGGYHGDSYNADDPFTRKNTRTKVSIWCISNNLSNY
jgi:RNA polymerase-associated protein RTF1